MLDDLHAADEPSLLLLRFVARGLAAAPLLVVGAYRDVDPRLADPLAATLAELAREPATRMLSLHGLEAGDVARFIELTTEHAAAASLVESVHAGTAGNPLFVAETVRLLAVEGRLDDPAARPTVPQSLKEMIVRRLRDLSPETSRLLSVAAVVGREFDIDLVARVSGLERGELLEFLDEATAQQLVTELPGSRARLGFGHALFRDALYEQLPPSRRRDLHRQVGEALESFAPGESRLAELAHHFSEAVPAVDPRLAVEYAQRAGDHAITVLAPEEALRLYDMALSIVGDEERPRLLLRTRSMWMAGDPGGDRVVEARDALLAAGDREGAAEAELLLASIHWYEGWRGLVSEDMERALAIVRDRAESAMTAAVLEHAARFHMLADESEQAVDLGRQALGLAGRLGLNGLEAHCLSDIGVARVRSGDLAGLDDLRLGLETALAAHDGWAAWRARANLADCLFWQVGDAERAFFERHELRRLLSAAGSWAMARWNQAYDAWEAYWTGRWAETSELCADFIERVEAGNPHTIASELYSLRALIGAARGEEHALDDAQSAVTLGRRAHDPRILYPAVAHNAWIAAELGRPDEADLLVDELLHAEGAEPFPNYVVPLSLAAFLRGRAEEIVRRLEHLVPSPWCDAAAALLQGDHAEAADLLAKIGVLPEEATARLLAAEDFAAAGRTDDAESQLSRCTPFFERVDATAYLRRAEQLR